MSMRYKKYPARRGHRISSRTTRHKNTTLSRVQLQPVLTSMLTVIRLISRPGRRQNTSWNSSRQRRRSGSRDGRIRLLFLINFLK